jgi:hypothetical protein
MSSVFKGIYSCCTRIEEKILTAMNELMKCKDDLHFLQAERTAYLKAALKMFQRGIVELELQVFLGIHSSRSKKL